MMSLINFNRRLPLLDTMFPDIMDPTDRLFDEELFLKNNWMPAMNVKEHKDDFEIEVAAPGFSKKDFEVSIEDNILKISAEKEVKSKKEDENYSRREFYYNAFNRSFALPKSIDLKKKIKANYENGVLLIHLEKLEASKKIEHKKVIQIS